MQPNQLQVVDQLLAWMVDVSQANFSATMWEDVIRGEVVHRALRAGWMVTLNKNTPLFDVSVLGGVLREAPSRTVATQGSNPDIRIVQPAPVRAELKVRGRFGPGATRPTAQVDADFDEVIQGRADVFLLALDKDAYSVMRSGNATKTWPNELPPEISLTTTVQCFPTSRSGTATVTRARVVSTPFGERIVAGFSLP